MTINLLKKIRKHSTEEEKLVIDEVLNLKQWYFKQLGLEREPVILGEMAKEVLETRFDPTIKGRYVNNPPDWISLTNDTIFDLGKKRDKLTDRISGAGIIIKKSGYDVFNVPRELWGQVSSGIMQLLELERGFNDHIDEAIIMLTIRQGRYGGKHNYNARVHMDGVKYQNRWVGHQLIVSNTGGTRCWRSVNVNYDEMQTKFNHVPKRLDMKNEQHHELSKYVHENSIGPVKRTKPFGIYLMTENMPHASPIYFKPKWRSFWRLSVEYRKIEF